MERFPARGSRSELVARVAANVADGNRLGRWPEPFHNPSGRWPYAPPSQTSHPGLQPGLENRLGRWPEMQDARCEM